MNSELVKKLRLAFDPVAIYFTDEKPQNALQFEEGKRGCVASMLIACATNGKTAVFDAHTYGCPGGGVGLCFGNAFEKNDHPTVYLLSTGDEALKAHGKTLGRSLGRGERFYATPALAGRWKASMPYVETGKRYVVFRPLSLADETGPPDLVVIFANPDQLSALVVLAGFNRGTALNVVAPFVSACQHIVLAYREMEKDTPNAIMGFFDISQRHRIPKDMLSFTVPYGMFKEMEESAPQSCLTTKAWERIESR